MARRAPAIERAVAVLNFLAAHSTESFTLSDLARRLDLNKATAHAMLNTFVEAGYLLRNPVQKTYSLGPALIALGNAATGSYQAAQIATDVMQEMSAELDLDCIASTAIEGEIVILARSGTPRPLGINVVPGLRLPLVPPLGTVFVAWSPQEEIDRWLEKVGPSRSAEDLERYRQAIGIVRERGYSVGLEGEAQMRLVEALRELEERTRYERSQQPTGQGDDLEGRVEGLRHEEYALVELEHSATYRLNHIGAPVFGPDGDVALALFLIGFRGQLTAEEVPRYANRVLEAAATVTKAIHGRPPEGHPF
jgi:DNA-binding IclR family transcriptional regulator